MSDATDENLFERWDLDPGADPAAITERLRELLLEADPGEQEQLRRAWEQLTTHPKRRISEALSTYPETRPPLGRAPRPPQAASTAVEREEDRLIHAPVSSCLGPPPPLPSALPRAHEDPLVGHGMVRLPNGGPS